MDDPRSMNPHADLGARMRTLAHDLQRARDRLAAGKLTPERQAILGRLLDKRLEDLEAEVHRRLLVQATTAPQPQWRPPAGGAS